MSSRSTSWIVELVVDARAGSRIQSASGERNIMQATLLNKMFLGLLKLFLLKESKVRESNIRGGSWCSGTEGRFEP